MKLSIIIPCYNQGEYLGEALDSAIYQTKKAEIIVIDDGSTDNTRQIAESYPIKVINQVNKGLPSARNTGIMNATGDYILPLDADDMLMDNAVEKIEEAIEKTNADVIAPSFKTFGLHSQSLILNAIPSIKEFSEANRIGYFSAIKKSVLLEIGGYSPRMLQGWEDYHLWLDIFTRGKSLCVLSDVLVLYRTKEQSMYQDSLAYSDSLKAQMIKDFPTVWSS